MKNSVTALPQNKFTRRAFTLVQILVVISIIAILGALFFGVMGRGREAAHRAQCDARLKAITLALDAYRQDNGSFPKTLAALQSDQYLRDAENLRCPDDPRPVNEAGYEEFYVVRAARDADDRPFLVCPFHEKNGHGLQAFKGRYTAQYPARPARIIAARSATVTRPGKAPIAASAGMELRGGDRISTGAAPLGGVVGGVLGDVINVGGGEIVIEFADTSTATLRSGTSATVLQSFVMGQANAPLYTLIRQNVGEAIYKVNSGSKFDVVTPTATSGARGTEFKITVKANGETELHVIEGKVAFTTLRQTIVATLGQTVSGLLSGLINLF